MASNNNNSNNGNATSSIDGCIVHSLGYTLIWAAPCARQMSNDFFHIFFSFFALRSANNNIRRWHSNNICQQLNRWQR